SSCLETLARACTPDLFLAFAAHAGDGVALGLLKTRVEIACRQALGRRADEADAARELASELLEPLLTPGPQGHTRLEAYRGRGPLGAWLKVAATRAMLNRTRSPRQELPLEEALLPASRGDLETELLVSQHGALFTEAFRDALAALPA